MTNQNVLDSVLVKLQRYNKKKNIAAALYGLEKFVILSLSVFFLLTLIEYIFHLSSIGRAISLTIFVASGFLSLLIWVFYPLVKGYLKMSNAQLENLAYEVGKMYPDINDRLSNALQLMYDEGSGQNIFGSMAVNQTLDSVGQYEFSDRIEYSLFRKKIPITILVILLFLILLFGVNELRNAALRIYNYSLKYEVPQKYSFEVSPGNTTITKGQSVVLKTSISGSKPKRVFIYTKFKEDNDFRKKEIAGDSLGSYGMQLSSIQSELSYYFSADEILSDRYTVTVQEKPIIKQLLVTVKSPAYTKIPELEQLDNGSVNCLAGSKIHIRATASKELSSAEMILNDSTKVPMKVSERDCSVDIIAKSDVEYFLTLRDINLNTNESPVKYSVKVVYDIMPVIELLVPKKDTYLAADQRNQISVKISDDFGFTDLKLHYRLSKSDFEKPQDIYSIIPISIDKLTKEQTVNYYWNLSGLSLVAGDVISYYLEVADNDEVSGPKKTRTAELTIRQPSIDEIAKQSDVQQEQTQNDLSKSLKEAEELKKELEAISNDLKKDKKELTWDEKERMQNALKKFEKLKENATAIQEKIKNNTNELQKNNLLSKETLEKYSELQKLLSEFKNENLQKLLDRMQQNLSKMDRQISQEDMKNLKMNEELFKKSIERTMNLLKRIQIEQKLDELAKKVEQLEKEQNDNTDRTSKDSDGKQSQGSKKHQDKITQDLKDLKKEFNELNDKMDEFKDLPSDMSKELEKEFSEQNNDKLSEDASKDLQSGNNSKSGQKQKQISKQLSKISKGLKSLQSSMMQQQQKKVFTDIVKILNEVITLSQKEEDLKNSSLKGENEISFKQNAKQQDNIRQELNNIVNQLGQLAQKTFAITPEMGKSLGDAQRKIEESLSNLQSRNAITSAESQLEAMKSLNETAASLKQSAESLMQGGGQGGGMMSLMQQLGKLSGQQMSLNNMAQKMMQGGQGQYSQEQLQMMDRMAQQQEMIKKSLEQLNKEAKNSGDSKRLPGSLEQIAKQMEEVISDLRSQKMSDNLIQKQERILSRMLDAQLSMNERDFEKERESNSAKNIVGKNSKGSVTDSPQSDKLRDELQIFSKEAFLKDYEKLIRKYLEKLNEIEKSR